MIVTYDDNRLRIGMCYGPKYAMRESSVIFY